MQKALRVNKNVFMTEETNPILRRIDAAGAAKTPPLKRYAIARLANVDESTIRKLESKPDAGMNARTISKLAIALDVSTAYLLGEDETVQKGRRAFASPEHDKGEVPILGSAAGAAVASFILSPDPIDWIERPPALRRVRDAYAVYVENDSMSPMHQRGDLRFVDPHRPARVGDSVIVQTVDANGERQAWIKMLEKRMEGWLVCRQLNPPAEVKYKWENVVSVHRVLTLAELFNR